MFLTFLLCTVAAIGWLRGSCHPAPVQQHPGEPRKGFSHQAEEWGQPRPVGAEWTPLEQRVLDGSHQSTGWLWKPGIPGQQNPRVWATTPWSLLDLWQDGHLHRAMAARLRCTPCSVSKEQWVAQPPSRI